MKIHLDALDKLFSEFIRKRAIVNAGGCERCHTPKFDIQKEDGSVFPAWKQLQCSHYIGRNNHSTRYYEDDGAGLCGACHMYFASYPYEHTEFFKKRLGEIRFNLLLARARQIGKLDKNGLTLYFRQKIKELCYNGE